MPWLLGAAEENRRHCSHSSSLGCEEPSTYGASGEQGEAQGNPALIDKAVTSRRRCWIQAPLVSFEGEEFLQASWGPWGAAISNVDIIPLFCSGSSVL